MLIGENILEFFADGNEYYEEWYDDVKDSGGWIMALNFREHILDEMQQANIHHYIHVSEQYADISWRKYKPNHLIDYLDDLLIKLIE